MTSCPYLHLSSRVNLGITYESQWPLIMKLRPALNWVRQNTSFSLWFQNKNWIEHFVVSGFRCWSQLPRLALALPIWLPRKLHCQYSFLTIAGRLCSLLLSIHNIPTILKEKSSPLWNLNLLNLTYQYGRQWLHFRTTDARSSLYFEISDQHPRGQ